MFSKLTLKEIIFLAIFSAALLLISGAVMPIVMFTNIFALRQLLAAPIFALFCVIALMKVPKLGALTVVGVLSGSVLLFMSPIMFYNNILGAILVELLVMIIYKGYKSQKSIIIASALYMPLTIPISLPITVMIKGGSIQSQLQGQSLLLLIAVGSIVLGFLGALAGSKIGKELKRTGKL